VAPSILSANFARLGEQVCRCMELYFCVGVDDTMLFVLLMTYRTTWYKEKRDDVVETDVCVCLGGSNR